MYFQSHEPWKLIDADKKKAGSVLRSCLQIAKALIILMDPVMPSKMQAAWKQLGLEGSVETEQFEEAIVPLPVGHRLGKPEILFGRLEDKTVKQLEDIFKERMSQAESKDQKEMTKKLQTISFEQFRSVDLRIGEIREAEPIKGSSKLLKLVVDIGNEKRQVVAGIAETYQPKDLIGTQVAVVANLEPAKLFGVESQAMLLAADIGGKALLLRPQEIVQPGTKIR
jgi:methionyl-tRNA synthetase